MIIRSIIVVMLVGLLAACSTTTRGQFDWDREASFADYREFAWISDHPLIVAEGTTEVISPLTERRVMDAVERQLAAKGYAKIADPDAADFVLSFTIGTRERIRVDSYPDPYFRYAWTWYDTHWPHWDYYYGVRGYPSRTVTRSYTEGTLAIDVFDGEGKNPVWHGWATRSIRDSDVENPEAAINEAVAAILENFPPQ